ncbi:MAG: metalloregulator ArsR/SmtB family transcription factor [Ignavibacteriales bacterium]|nr:metalloregulator ArsR/SmtB family transcription factor [Ignavibacteriales bacterium]
MDDSIKLQNLFQTLGDANRLKIIRIIGDQRRSVSEIVGMSGLSQPLASHHLRVLREQNILKTKREGPFIYYELSDVRMLDALGIFSELLINSVNKTRGRETMFTCREQWMKFFNNK